MSAFGPKQTSPLAPQSVTVKSIAGSWHLLPDARLVVFSKINTLSYPKTANVHAFEQARRLERLAHVRDFAGSSRGGTPVSETHGYEVVQLLRR
jgi:hypothetical protein